MKNTDEESADLKHRLRTLVQEIAILDLDGECMEHGPSCSGDRPDDCVLFEMTNDDAYDTLHNLIHQARTLIKAFHGPEPYTVGEAGPDNTGGFILGRFATEDEAAAFIETLPDYKSGRYYLDGPDEED